MSLRKDQSEFVRMVALLILFADRMGFELTFGDAMAKDGHKDNSFHYKRLAIDLNLFQNGVYLTESVHHTQLGNFWMKIGGTWGGTFDPPDGNHYSLGEGINT